MQPTEITEIILFCLREILEAAGPLPAEPFTVETLDALYRNRGQYVSSVIQVTNETVNRGYLLDEDAKATIDAAKRTSVGMP